MSHILVIGSANADHVMNFEYLPAPGQTLMSRSYRLEHGGKGANQAVAAKARCVLRLGFEIRGSLEAL